jgi:flagellar motor switch protein FliN/FliY
MNTQDSLLKLGQSSSEAAAGVLATFCPDGVERGAVTILPADASPFAALAFPAVVAGVSYVDGVTGGNAFVMTQTSVRRLAAAMMMLDPDEVDPEAELTELDLSAAGEAMNQMMAAAAAATSGALGEDVEIGPPDTRVVADANAAADAVELTPHVISVAFTVLGEPCRFLQLVPNAFVLRMTRALSDLAAVETADRRGGEPGSAVSEELVRAVPVRVWAELGRTQMPVGRAVGLPVGTLVDLDRDPEEPVQLYVNGRPFANGRLLLVHNEWAVRIEEILPGGPQIPHP